MTFAQKNTSEEDGNKAVLYRFDYGGNLPFLYTDWDVPLQHNGETYEATYGIGREGLEQSGTLDAADVPIDIDPRAPIVAYFANGGRTANMGVQVFERHVDDGETLLIFVGKVISTERSQSGAMRLICEPEITSLRRPGLRRNYQYTCPWLLFSQEPGECGVNEATFLRTEPTISVGGNTITLGPTWFGAVPENKYLNGYVRWTHNSNGRVERRTVRALDSVIPNTLILSGTVVGLANGENVEVLPGCNHLRGSGGDCTEIYANDVNYGGQDRIPKQNPTGFTNVYY